VNKEEFGKQCYEWQIKMLKISWATELREGLEKVGFVCVYSKICRRTV
jgi:hypothetical protein